MNRFYSSAVSAIISNEKNHSAVVLAQVIFCSLLIAFCAQIRIPLFFTPVPLTLQTLAVMVVGCMLGSKYAAYSAALYVVESMVGLPVLSGGRSDMLGVVSPIGGYLVGYIMQAYLTGWFVERVERFGGLVVFCGLLVTCALQLSLGSIWLGTFVGYGQGFLLGFVPFIPGEMLKVAAVTAFLLRSQRKHRK